MTAAAGAEATVAARGSPNCFAECSVGNEAHERTPTPALKLFAFGAFATIGAAVLIGLGVWQLERRGWERDPVRWGVARGAGPPGSAPPPPCVPPVQSHPCAPPPVPCVGAFFNCFGNLVRVFT